jgi:DNA-binding SARP family transcriptional activator/tetratricopeptide (TPR) repeat protein
MQFGVLGPLQVAAEDSDQPDVISAALLRTLLAVLLWRAGQPVPTGELAELVWDGVPPDRAQEGIRALVLRLRRQLDKRIAARIVTRAPGYAIEVSADELDALRFETLTRQAGTAIQAGRWAQAGQAAAEALGLWRGAPLADVPSQLLRDQWVPRLDQLHVQALEWRIEADLHDGRPAQLIPELEDLTARHPLREQFHSQLMLALYRSGRQAEALAAYRRARDVLVTDLGVEPGPGLRDLHQRMLSADPALAIPEPAQPAEAGPGRVTPQELPAAAAGFTGRTAELRALTGLLDRSGAHAPGAVVISAIGGTAGVGKTALAVYWAHRQAGRFPDGQLYVNLRGYDPGQPLTAADALARLLRSLGVSGQDIPPEEEERAARYRSLLAGKQVLVVLDNAGSADQVRPLLPGTTTCTVLVTSRDALAGLVALDGAARLDLDVLPRQDAVTLLRTLIGPRVDAEPAAAAELADQCCRLPLALRVAAELAVTRLDTPLATLTGELADLHARLDLLAADGDPRTQVRTVFSWSYRHLDAETARTFRLAGLHPGPDIDPYAAAALAGATEQQARQALDVLARAHLVQPVSPGRYGMHDLLRGYARELTATHDTGQEQRAALTRLLDYYLHAAIRTADILFPDDTPASASPPDGASGQVFTGEQAARAWLDAERANLTAVAAHASKHGWPGHATGLSAALFRYLERSGFLADALLIYEAAARAEAQAGDRAAEAAAVNNIGTVYLQLGRNGEAGQRFERALALSRQAGDQLGELRALLSLSMIGLLIGAYPAGIRNGEQALELSRATGNRTREARALYYLGLIAIRQGRYPQAAAGLLRASETSRMADDLPFLIVSLTNLGDVEVRQGHYPQARRHLKEAKTIARQLDHPMADADATASLGFADLREGRYQQARRQLRQALAAFHDAGVPRAEAEVLCRLGESDLRLGRPVHAAGRYQQALILCQQAAEPSGEAEARNGLGEAALAQEAPEDARAHHQAALDIARQIGSQEQQARAHEGLGNIDAASSDAPRARAHWQQALALYAEMETPDAERIRGKLTVRDNA